MLLFMTKEATWLSQIQQNWTSLLVYGSAFTKDQSWASFLLLMPKQTLGWLFKTLKVYKCKASPKLTEDAPWWPLQVILWWSCAVTEDFTDIHHTLRMVLQAGEAADAIHHKNQGWNRFSFVYIISNNEHIRQRQQYLLINLIGNSVCTLESCHVVL